MAEDALDGGHVGLGEAADLDDDEEPPDRGHQDGHETEQEVGRGQDGQPEQPKPEQQIDLKMRVFRIRRCCTKSSPFHL